MITQPISPLANTAIVYSQTNCPACETAKRLLTKHGYIVDVRQLDGTPEMKKRLVEDFPEARSVPQVIVEGQRIGNLHALNDYLTV